MLLQGFRQDCISAAPIPLTQDKLTTPSICMPTDALSMQRLQGKKVRFVTGTDEHGEKIAEAAKARGMQPQEHCDSVVEEYKSLWTQVLMLVHYQRLL